METQLAWEAGDRLVVTCSGSLSWDAQDYLVRPIHDAIESRCPRQVLVDLEAVDMVTSAGLGCILQIRKQVVEQGARLVLTSAPPMIAQLFRLVGLDRHVDMTGTLESGRELLDACPQAAQS